MYQLETRFQKIAAAKPALSSYMVFAETVRNTGLSESTIRRWFYRLVDREDYAQNEARSILRFLVSLA
jgi:hypothetical protein